MSIRFVMQVTIKREPAECTPGRDPGWYVKDRENIIAYTHTLEEANRVAAWLSTLPRFA
jgi:hypothetical protein